ncbi:hypothetical protein LEP1GSC043_4863 [Leptospira weilii str. Ecochallenge]|uniref:Uncharacterized protein n=3 Tax=Leptospira weilii TaxID=28184 RepID=N1TY95_9LEPT|nr:hypothetical protein LEP1GSC038_0385 [Leptospira weilii str. 2006001855]EMN89924.1 hypothetical protein LEP1GSC108_3973 [Leptospira weilii str. UI 13098]EMY13263.1 hypothetical protein LEP1GSC043_4863 [Leptospira weilii str. Ecochallenge]OMI15831.1 hypothetical protein BUQ74_18815 [Leptospira weilii serovar Heyan]QDK25132.1 hypothetical protein FHG67_20820 [Leptospira weilii]
MEFELVNLFLKYGTTTNHNFTNKFFLIFLYRTHFILFSKKLQRSAEILIRSNGFGTRSYYITWKDIYD